VKYHVEVRSPVSKTFRAASVLGKFDYDPGDESVFSFDAELPTDEKDWQVGLIVGPSGSGKSLLMNAAFEACNITSGFTWQGASILDDFPEKMAVDAITRALTAVGLSSTPVWLLPFAALSNGQRFRADLARALATSDYVVYDEFTSVVDRDVAKAAALAVSKATRKKAGKRFVAVSCHSDIIEWLEPDWVFHTEGYQLVRGRLRRPSLAVDVYAGSYRDYPLFAKNHYLNRPIPRNALVYLGVLEVEGRRRIVALDCYHSCPGVRGVYIGGQGVVLPEFQGLGIGMRFFDTAAELTHQRKHVRVRNIVGSQVVNEYWAARSKRPGAAWKLVSNARRHSADGGRMRHTPNARAVNRLVCSWEYVPEARRGNGERAQGATSG
jgi:ABC-type lipoprotein export system ATPase subunit/GNAT superfamily N-acetyltransferase